MNVSEKPLTITKQLEAPKKVMEEETVELTVETSKPVEKTEWLHKGKAVTPTEKVEITADGTKHKLTIKDAAASDSGEYTFKAGDQKSSATLTVKGSLEHSDVIAVIAAFSATKIWRSA